MVVRPPSSAPTLRSPTPSPSPSSTPIAEARAFASQPIRLSCYPFPFLVGGGGDEDAVAFGPIGQQVGRCGAELSAEGEPLVERGSKRVAGCLASEDQAGGESCAEKRALVVLVPEVADRDRLTQCRQRQHRRLDGSPTGQASVAPFGVTCGKGCVNVAADQDLLSGQSKPCGLRVVDRRGELRPSDDVFEISVLHDRPVPEGQPSAGPPEVPVRRGPRP